MNLQLSLIIRIILTAFICLVANAAYVLYHNDQQAKQQAIETADRIENEIQTQLQRIYDGHDHSTSFPDAKLWQNINGLPGSCIQFESLSNSRQRFICNEEAAINQSWPSWFGTLYQQFFTPDYQAKRKVVFFALSFGTIVVTLNKQSEISSAWTNLRGLMGLTFMTVLALATLVYITVSRILKPAQLIVNGLEKMREGQLDTRIASFEVNEWRRTSDAINQLAISQQQVMAENQQLALKLMNAQEEEHRYIARELHDEFGQCLAGINAINSSINQTAKQQCPDLVEESDKVSEITRHMMDVLRSLLTRLRPAEVDDFGLTSSLKKLVASWNNRTHGETLYQLTITGNIEQLVEPFPVNIYRIIQECLTNIAKHAQASKASITIDYQANSSFQLIISDDGIATETTILDNQMGMGLIGIRERVSALAGQLEITSQSGSGMTILITLPIHTYEQPS
ncbi:sensor histidine kinase [Methylophaga sp. 41_12_T18]|nr:sensor histidine kinase [Methylophaga sp. 41_12_T18]